MQIAEIARGSVATKACINHAGWTQVPQAESRATGARRIRVLVVEDNASDSELMLHALKNVGYESECEVVQTADDFADRIRKNKYDIILADYRLPGWNGMETVRMVRQEDLDIPVVLVSGALGELKAVECIKAGAADYVLKDHLARLPQSVRRAIQERDLRD
jgi:DNA-binding NtrC family response regulator